MNADECRKNGFHLPALPQPFLDWLTTKEKSGVISLTNPLDFGDIWDFDLYPKIIEKLLAFEEIDGVFYDVGYAPYGELEPMHLKVLEALNKIRLVSSKPVYARVPFFNLWLKDNK